MGRTDNGWAPNPLIPTDWQRLLGDWVREAHAQRPPEEACGLLVGQPDGRGGWVLARITRSPNRATQPGRRFRIAAEHLMEQDRLAVAEGLGLFGAWHSHPSGEGLPSQADHAELPGGWLGWVVTLDGDEVRITSYGSGRLATEV